MFDRPITIDYCGSNRSLPAASKFTACCIRAFMSRLWRATALLASGYLLSLPNMRFTYMSRNERGTSDSRKPRSTSLYCSMRENLPRGRVFKCFSTAAATFVILSRGLIGCGRFVGSTALTSRLYTGFSYLLRDDSGIACLTLVSIVGKGLGYFGGRPTGLFITVPGAF